MFSGIGAVSLASHRLGWTTVWASEIDKQAQGVYARHFPGARLVGDCTRFEPGEDDAIDLLAAGFPCQTFSVAGRRAGMEGGDDRGQLFWEIVRVARRLRPPWLFLENVPGLLSSSRGRDFAVILHALDELGYGVSWASLDAQFFGLAQRRERVFLVGRLGGPCPPEILFEPEGVCGDSPTRREAGEDVAGTLGGGAGSRGWAPDTDRMTFVPHLANALQTTSDDYSRADGFNMVAHTLKAEGSDASEDGTGRGVPIVAMDMQQVTSKANRSKPYPQSPPLTQGQQIVTFPAVVANGDAHSGFRDEREIVLPLLEIGKGTTSRGEGPNGAGFGKPGDPMFTLQAGAQHGIATSTVPRRLTPRECERLQGFPDDWTRWDAAGRELADGPRYRMLGNSMAVPVISWILRRAGGLTP
jgi:DNA (cytosine-5)-methyltransferase 1